MYIFVLESNKDTDIDLNDNENGKSNHHAKKYPYPRGVPFIISTEFCERFSYYGMKSKSNFSEARD